MRRKQWILSVLADVLFALGLAAVAIGIAMSGSIPLAVCVGGAETAVCAALILDGLFRRPRERRADPVNVTTLESVGMQNIVMGGETAAMKLAAVNRCLEVISDSVGKMPSYGMITSTRERVFPPVLDLLNLRPNEAMTPFIRRKMLELNRLIRGFAVEWILRDPITMEPVELIPVPSELVNFWQDTAGHVWYDITHPYNLSLIHI